MKFGKFIDDIRKEIKYFNAKFESCPFGDRMIITFPPKTISFTISREYLGEINYNSPMHTELLDLTLDHLRDMSKI